MRYYVKVHPYVGKNQAQKNMSDFVTRFQNILLDYDKEQEAFMNHVAQMVEDTNDSFPRCKPMQMHTWTDEDNVMAGCSVESVFSITFHAINEKRFKEFHAKDTYRRVDYLVRKAKEQGYDLDKHHNERTFIVPVNQFPTINQSKYLRELKHTHNYGIQAAIPQ